MRTPRSEERVKGIEPSSSAWEADALPLSYTRDRSSPLLAARAGRITLDCSRQISRCKAAAQRKSEWPFLAAYRIPFHRSRGTPRSLRHCTTCRVVAFAFFAFRAMAVGTDECDREQPRARRRLSLDLLTVAKSFSRCNVARFPPCK